MSRAPILILAALAAVSLQVPGFGAGQAGPGGAGVRDWPVITAETKPWTRWWWHGSAVERGSLSAQLEVLRAAGLGGVEITPIYGVRGREADFIPYLSERWVRMLEHTLREAERLGLGVDMATGTGWPFGGPWIGDDTAPRSLAFRTWTVTAGGLISEPIRMAQAPLVRAVGNQVHVVNEGAPGDPPRGTTAAPTLRAGARAIQIEDLVEPIAANRNLQALALEQVKFRRDLPLVSLVAYGEGGQAIDLMPQVSRDRVLDWVAPSGTWTVYGVFAGWHGKLVERAAPGGEGHVIDHFSPQAIRSHLAAFDRAFAGRGLHGLRAFFNDSYEVDDATGQADWTPALIDEFARRRGYDLRRYLPALFGRDTEDRNARVLADYRETLSDLLLDRFTLEWRNWSHRRGSMIRNQAHGSPASLLDLYAASDIPETEGLEIQRFKWAASAAHVAGRQLVSAEAATWLGEHFRSTLNDVRANLDRFFISGVNHIVYHGTAYSPASEPWPGRLFYASVAFSPQNAWWDDFDALNGYVTRVQSFLQRGSADHDVLLYFPFYDSLTVRGAPGAMLTHFGGASPRPLGTVFESAAEVLQREGYTYDFISDRQLRHAEVSGDRVRTAPDSRYRVLVIPQSRFIPVETFEGVVALARRGATVISLADWPADVSGLGGLDVHRERLARAKALMRFGPVDSSGIREARLGAGRVLQGGDLAPLLQRAGIAREALVDQGLQFARRRDNQGRIYFVSNPTDRAVDGWVPFASDDPALTVFDPMLGQRGNARVRRTADRRVLEARLQLPAGGSLIVASSKRALRDEYPVYRAAGPAVAIGGQWRLQFIKGGPSLPVPRTIERLESWTMLDGDDGPSFSGTATYSLTVDRPAVTADAWQLDLGDVRDSARVRVDGRDAGTLIGPPYRVILRDLRSRSEIQIDVTNLSANRIADLERRGVPWKNFYNVNFPARLPDNRGADGLFTAAKWEPLDSGLLGPVTLTPLAVVR